MKRTTKMTMVVLVLLDCMLGVSSAAVYDFSGTVLGIEDAGGLLDGSVINGSTFSGSYSFDPGAPAILATPLLILHSRSIQALEVQS